jgi:hypothetical protein
VNCRAAVRENAGAIARRARLAAAALVAAVLASAAFAAPMYKWVDANGKVIYSDQPPPGNVKTEILQPPPPPANPNAAQELIDKENELKLRDKKRAEDAKAAEAKRAEVNRKRENCQTAMAQVRTLQQKEAVLFRYNDKGEKVYFDDATRAAELERAQQYAREACAQ